MDRVGHLSFQIRPSKNPPQPSDSSSRPSATLLISPASVSDAISRLQQEKTRLQKNLDQKQALYEMKETFLQRKMIGSSS